MNFALNIKYTKKSAMLQFYWINSPYFNQFIQDRV